MKPYLLLVEDNETTAYLTLEALKRSVFPGEVLRVVDGEEAIQHLFSKKSRPTLILLDMNLPSISGLDVLETVRNTVDLMTIPVILQTASNYALDSEQDRAHALGISRYLVKPMEFQDLLAQMAEVTTLFRAAVDQDYC